MEHFLRQAQHAAHDLKLLMERPSIRLMISSKEELRMGMPPEQQRQPMIPERQLLYEVYSLVK